MAFKTQHFIEVTKNENTYTFNIPNNATFGEAYDAAFEAMQTIRHKLVEASEEAERQKAEEDEHREVDEDPDE